MNLETETFIKLALKMQAPLTNMGVTIEAIEPGSVTLSVRITESMTTIGTGVVMGGVIAMIADVTAGLSVISLMDRPRPVTTIDFTAHQISAAKGERLLIVGRAERISKILCVSGADTFSYNGEQKRKCARLTATFLIPS